MHKLGSFFTALLLVLIAVTAYGITFAAIWIGTYAPELWGYIGIFLVLAFLTYMFLHGAYYITHTGKKVTAELLPLSSMDAIEFRAAFKKNIEEVDEKLACVARYEIDGKWHSELVGISRIYGMIPGNNTVLYVVAHKAGVKTDYEVKTKEDVVRNLCIGIPFAIAVIGLCVLFVMRGI